jgi:hypothetical protein
MVTIGSGLDKIGHHLLIRYVLVKYWRENGTVHPLFIDLRFTCDSVWGKLLYYILLNLVIQCDYREVLTVIDRFMAQWFTATGAPPAARRIQILPMNQYACWPITLGMK